MKDMKKELQRLRQEQELVQEVPCTEEENERLRALLQSGTPLPENVYRQEGTKDEVACFYTLRAADLTEAEVREYLLLRQCSDLETIKNCVLFVTALTILGLALLFVL